MSQTGRSADNKRNMLHKHKSPIEKLINKNVRVSGQWKKNKTFKVPFYKLSLMFWKFYVRYNLQVMLDFFCNTTVQIYEKIPLIKLKISKYREAFNLSEHECLHIFKNKIHLISIKNSSRLKFCLNFILVIKIVRITDITYGSLNNNKKKRMLIKFALFI